MAALATLGWKILNHHLYNPNLAPSDFHLFGSLKEHLEGQKFDTDDELGLGVLNWLCG
jgi:histone-lysine N-methyltransferase SETMAR